MTDDHPIKEKKQDIDDFLRYSRSEQELRATIKYLIRNREQLRDRELKCLEVESDELLKRLHETNRQKILTELGCFKDVLALHRRLIEAKEKLR